MTATQTFWLIIGLTWTVSELFIAISTRKQQESEVQIELYSEMFIWLVICLSILFALSIKNLHWFTIDLSAYAKFNIGFCLLALGLGLRIYAVLCLGVFFTTQLSIQTTQRLVDKGPYHYIRHPSYTGLIFSFMGAGIAMGDFLSLVILLIPLIYILIKRINIEEILLKKHFGKDYVQYCQRTKKLIPGLY